MNKVLILFFLMLLAVFTLEADSPMGIVIMCENGGSLGPDGSMMETVFELNRTRMQNMLAEIFDIESSEMDSMDLTEIVDVYGEEWQMSEMRDRCEGYYERIITLSDEYCTPIGMFDSLAMLRDEGLIVDLVFILHGDPDHVMFTDYDFWIENMTSMMQDYEIPLRALYQTCCWGSHMIDDWEEIGITAVNGAYQTNYFPLFAPIFFLESWTAGFDFNDAVQMALNAEIDTIETYSTDMPFLSTFLLTEENIESSEQIIGGEIPDLEFIDYYSSSIEEIAYYRTKEKIEVYPNPAIGGKINIKAPKGSQEITIYDINGKRIKNFFSNYENNLQIEIDNLNAGTYIISNNNPNENLSCQIIIIN
ncbi:MAG: T9SS type A sorting domain-containing protein [Candidatus Zixiibacteriota bacterium]